MTFHRSVTTTYLSGALALLAVALPSSVPAAETLNAAIQYAFVPQSTPGEPITPLCQSFLDYLNSKTDPRLFDSRGRLLVEDARFKGLNWLPVDSQSARDSATFTPHCPQYPASDMEPGKDQLALESLVQGFHRRTAVVQKSAVRLEAGQEPLWLFRVNTIEGYIRYWIGSETGTFDMSYTWLCRSSKEDNWLLYEGQPLMVLEGLSSLARPVAGGFANACTLAPASP